MAQSSPQAAIVPTQSSSLVDFTVGFETLSSDFTIGFGTLSCDIQIAKTDRLFALTTETQEADVRAWEKTKVHLKVGSRQYLKVNNSRETKQKSSP